MVAKIIDGKSIAAHIRNQLRLKIMKQAQYGLARPTLAVILVGKDPASTLYVHHKHQACKEVGIRPLDYSLPANISQKKLITLIEKLNQDKSINGILLQLPLPKHIHANEVLDHIHPLKDVDGFHSLNFGKLAKLKPSLRPCTPYGIMLLLKHINPPLAGKNVVIIGASNIVGKPMALELLAKNCTITICHRMTQNLAQHINHADILISAVGKPNLIKGKWIKKGAIVIDVGITLDHNGKLKGDIQFDKAKERAKWITPVPGGVGPMTVAALLKNTVLAQTLQNKAK